jgi:hypothetical protein
LEAIRILLVEGNVEFESLLEAQQGTGFEVKVEPSDGGDDSSSSQGVRKGGRQTARRGQPYVFGRIKRRSGAKVSYTDQLPFQSQENRIMTVHGLPCSLCDLAFDTEQMLCQHTRRQHQKHLCVQCWQMFNSFQALACHRNTKHFGKTCPICHKGIAHQQHLKIHMRSVHGIDQ